MLKNYNLSISYSGKNVVYVAGEKLDLRKFKKIAKFKTGWLREALTLYFMDAENMEFQLADSLACKIIGNKDALTHYVTFCEIVVYEHIYKKALEDFKNWKKRAEKR